MEASRNYILDRMCSKVTTPADFNFDTLCAPPLSSFLSGYDIGRLYNVASSVKYAGKPQKRYQEIDNIMRSRGFTKLSAGTNRIVYRCEYNGNIVIKVAGDDVGRSDSPREFFNQQYLKPFVTKVFEVSPCGTVGLFERVNPITSREEYLSVASDVFVLLNEFIIGEYIMEDIGTKYFMNVGIRKGFGPVFLDFPFLYKLDGNKLFCRMPDPNSQSGCCDGIIDYDAGYNFLYCTKCGIRYRARDLAEAITNNQVKLKGDTKMKVRVTGGTYGSNNNTTSNKVVNNSQVKAAKSIPRSNYNGKKKKKNYFAAANENSTGLKVTVSGGTINNLEVEDLIVTDEIDATDVVQDSNMVDEEDFMHAMRAVAIAADKEDEESSSKEELVSPISFESTDESEDNNMTLEIDSKRAVDCKLEEIARILETISESDFRTWAKDGGDYGRVKKIYDEMPDAISASIITEAYSGVLEDWEEDAAIQKTFKSSDMPIKDIDNIWTSDMENISNWYDINTWTAIMTGIKDFIYSSSAVNPVLFHALLRAVASNIKVKTKFDIVETPNNPNEDHCLQVTDTWITPGYDDDSIKFTSNIGISALDDLVMTHGYTINNIEDIEKLDAKLQQMHDTLTKYEASENEEVEIPAEEEGAPMYGGVTYLPGIVVNIKDIFADEKAEKCILMIDENGNYVTCGTNNVIMAINSLDNRPLNTAAIVSKAWLGGVTAKLDRLTKEEEAENSVADTQDDED